MLYNNFISITIKEPLCTHYMPVSALCTLFFFSGTLACALQTNAGTDTEAEQTIADYTAGKYCVELPGLLTEKLPATECRKVAMPDTIKLLFPRQPFCHNDK